MVVVLSRVVSLFGCRRRRYRRSRHAQLDCSYRCVSLWLLHAWRTDGITVTREYSPRVLSCFDIRIRIPLLMNTCKNNSTKLRNSHNRCNHNKQSKHNYVQKDRMWALCPSIWGLAGHLGCCRKFSRGTENIIISFHHWLIEINSIIQRKLNLSFVNSWSMSPFFLLHQHLSDSSTSSDVHIYCRTVITSASVQKCHSIKQFWKTQRVSFLSPRKTERHRRVRLTRLSSEQESQKNDKINDNAELSIGLPCWFRVRAKLDLATEPITESISRTKIVDEINFIWNIIINKSDCPMSRPCRDTSTANVSKDHLKKKLYVHSVFTDDSQERTLTTVAKNVQTSASCAGKSRLPDTVCGSSRHVLLAERDNDFLHRRGNVHGDWHTSSRTGSSFMGGDWISTTMVIQRRTKKGADVLGESSSLFSQIFVMCGETEQPGPKIQTFHPERMKWTAVLWACSVPRGHVSC